MPKPNPLYSGNPREWETLLLQEQLEHIRRHYCLGNFGAAQSPSRDRTNAALRAAIEYLSRDAAETGET